MAKTKKCLKALKSKNNENIFTKKMILLNLNILQFTVITNAKIYVNAAVLGGSNNCTSWTNAYNSLESSITLAKHNDDISVAKGIYKPSAYPIGRANCASNRDFTFLLKDEVRLGELVSKIITSAV